MRWGKKKAQSVFERQHDRRINGINHTSVITWVKYIENSHGITTVALIRVRIAERTPCVCYNDRDRNEGLIWHRSKFISCMRN